MDEEKGLYPFPHLAPQGVLKLGGSQYVHILAPPGQKFLRTNPRVCEDPLLLVDGEVAPRWVNFPAAIELLPDIRIIARS